MTSRKFKLTECTRILYPEVLSSAPCLYPSCPAPSVCKKRFDGTAAFGIRSSLKSTTVDPCKDRPNCLADVPSSTRDAATFAAAVAGSTSVTRASVVAGTASATAALTSACTAPARIKSLDELDDGWTRRCLPAGDGSALPVRTNGASREPCCKLCTVLARLV